MWLRGNICAVTVLVVAISASFGSNASGKSLSKAAEKNAASKQSLERADFQMAGSSCASCLLRVEGKISKVPGVIKAAVSIYSPYTTIIIYDPVKTNLTKIHSALTGEPVKFENVSEHQIDKVPEVLLPAKGAPEGQAVH